MRSLAFKIFLGYWLMHALIFFVLAFVPDPNASRRLFDRMQHDGQVGAAIFERAGSTTCSEFLADVGRLLSARTGLYEASRGPVCGALGAQDQTRVSVLIRSATEEGRRASVGGRDTAVMRVRGPSREVYVIALVATGGAPLDETRPFFPSEFLIVTVIVSGIVCMVLAAYIAAPLGRLRQATHRLKEGDLTARAGFGGRNDEIGDVVRDFDAMADRIESLVRGQKQLLSDMSHELRSPLARLSVALELAKRSAGAASDAHLARIETEAARMNDLIGRLLLLARHEQAGSSVEFETFDLAALVRRVAEDASYEAKNAGKRVIVSGAASASVHGDPELLASAVDNVVRNAVRYTPASAPVEAALEQGADDLRVVVRDHGPGVPESELDRLFEPFYRLDASRNRESGGIGLGLSIAKRAVTMHGGTITAANAEGGGLQVTICLPTSSDARASR
jgi:two-component system, OmpR family, sensor histidine kinase CpxA